MKAPARSLTAKRKNRTACTLTPASASCATAGASPGIRDILDLRVGCWRPPVHVTLT
jgi:hypothetical protein